MQYLQNLGKVKITGIFLNAPHITNHLPDPIKCNSKTILISKIMQEHFAELIS